MPTPMPCRCCCGCSRPRTSTSPMSPPSATSRARSTSSRRSGSGPGSGSSPAARRPSPRSVTPRCYDIAEISILVVRVGPDEIKAYYNACLHRGRRLRSAAGRVSELRCPFHGFCWHLDGALKRVPSAWDFPHVDAEQLRPRPRCASVVGRFRLHHLDPDAEPLEDFLGALPEHFERWDLENRYTEAHVEKLLPCNWKIAQESFMESFHVAPPILRSRRRRRTRRRSTTCSAPGAGPSRRVAIRASSCARSPPSRRCSTR